MLFLQAKLGEKIIIEKGEMTGFIERRKNNKLIIHLPKEYKIYKEDNEQVQTTPGRIKKDKDRNPNSNTSGEAF
jgi:sRNA-binding carbon storage regulator CsrA